jgi:hypothetical protein
MSSAIHPINEGELVRFLLKPWNDEERLVVDRLGIERYRRQRAQPQPDQEREQQARKRRNLLEDLNVNILALTQFGVALMG